MSSVSSAASARSSASTTGTDNTKRLQITHVDAYGPYLRIYGQMNPDAMAVLRNRIQEMLRTCLAIDPTWPVQRQQVPLRIGTLCLYKSTKGIAPADFEFLRVRILDVIINSGQQNATHGQKPLVKVEVEFVDYGGKALVASYEVSVCVSKAQNILAHIHTYKISLHIFFFCINSLMHSSCSVINNTMCCSVFSGWCHLQGRYAMF